MWEITLIGKLCDYPYFIELQNEIVSKKLSAIVSIGMGENLSISIALDDNLENQIKDLILETIIKINKFEFILEHLNCIDEEKYASFVISSLVWLDLEEEVSLAKYYAKLEKTNHIREFLRFKLPQFFEAWKREVDAINLLFQSQTDDKIYLDFLKYLTRVSRSHYDVVYLRKALGDIVFWDNKKSKTKYVSNKDEIDILVNLIIYSPKKIIMDASYVSDKIYGIIKYIFDDKVSLVL